MEFSELIWERYSVRSYKPDEIEEEKLNAVLEAARIAPTAANRQPFQIIVIRTKGREKELNRIYAADWFVEAPIVICICAIPEAGWTRRYDGMNFAAIDAVIAFDHLILAAANQGLGTCWIGAFDPKAAKEVLNLPEGWEPVMFTPLGYPADKPSPKVRKSLDELVKYER